MKIDIEREKADITSCLTKAQTNLNGFGPLDIDTAVEYLDEAIKQLNELKGRLIPLGPVLRNPQQQHQNS